MRSAIVTTVSRQFNNVQGEDVSLTLDSQTHVGNLNRLPSHRAAAASRIRYVQQVLVAGNGGDPM